MSTRMKQVEVTIMGNSYLLGCPEGGEQALHEAVARVDKEMCAIRDSGKIKARERIAVLAALNLAYVLAQRPAAAATATASSAPSNRPAADHDAVEAAPTLAALDALLQRLDRALEQDGHLL